MMQSDPQMIKEIIEAVSIPVMAKARIGHIVCFLATTDWSGNSQSCPQVEAQILQAVGVDYIDGA
jgi:pyridoxal 5'-phosphate synthase pdxS subunit